MAADPSIALQAQPVQIQDPLAQYGKFLALKNALQQGQIGQQQLQEGNINLQQKRQLLADQQAFSQVMSDPAVGGDINKALPILSQKLSPQSYIPLSKSLLDNQKSIADTTKAKADAAEANQRVTESQSNMASDMLQGANEDIAKGIAPSVALQAHTNAFSAINPELKPKLDAMLSQVLSSQDHDATAKQIIQNGINNATRAKAAATQKDVASANESQAKADQLKRFNDLMQQGATAPSGVHPVDAVFKGIKVDPAVVQSYKAAYDNALPSSPENPFGGKNEILKAASAHAAQASAAQDPNLIKGAADKAAAEETAKIAPRVAGAVAERQAIAKTSPSAFEGIVDGTARNAAQTEADKVYKDYTDKVGNTQAFLASVNAARTNPAVAATIPMQEVRQFVNRVNTQEIRSVSSGVGGLLDRADTWLQKNTTGTPPKWLLDDIAQIAPIQIQQAQQGFNAGKQRLQLRGVDVTKLPPPDTGSAQAAASPKIGDTKTFPNGKVGKWDGQGWVAQ